MAKLRNFGVSLRDSDAQTRLATYLNDHLAGATGGVELARRACSANQGTEYGPFIAELVAEIEQDVEALRDIMRRLDASEDRLKQVAGWTGEKLGRLKLNGQLIGYSPLSRLIELEGLALGITGKLALWVALRETYGSDPRLTGCDLDRLAQRARDQRQGVERHRRKCAAEALR